MGQAEIREAIAESYPLALKRASLEAFEGMLDEAALADKVDEGKIKQAALELVTGARES